MADLHELNDFVHKQVKSSLQADAIIHITMGWKSKSTVKMLQEVVLQINRREWVK